MNHIEYDLLRKNRPELGLRAWYALPNHWKVYAEGLTPDELVARRTGVLLAREYGIGYDDYTKIPEGQIG